MLNGYYADFGGVHDNVKHQIRVLADDQLPQTTHCLQGTKSGEVLKLRNRAPYGGSHVGGTARAARLEIGGNKRRSATARGEYVTFIR